MPPSIDRAVLATYDPESKDRPKEPESADEIRARWVGPTNIASIIWGEGSYYYLQWEVPGIQARVVEREGVQIALPLAHAFSDVHFLLAENDKLREENADLRRTFEGKSTTNDALGNLVKAANAYAEEVEEYRKQNPGAAVEGVLPRGLQAVWDASTNHVLRALGPDLERINEESQRLRKENADLRRTLEDKGILHLAKEQREAFFNALMNPPDPKDVRGLKALLRPDETAKELEALKAEVAAVRAVFTEAGILPPDEARFSDALVDLARGAIESLHREIDDNQKVQEELGRVDAAKVMLREGFEKMWGPGAERRAGESSFQAALLLLEGTEMTLAEYEQLRGFELDHLLSLPRAERQRDLEKAQADFNKRYPLPEDSSDADEA
jgi:hypothetical protein